MLKTPISLADAPKLTTPGVEVLALTMTSKLKCFAGNVELRTGTCATPNVVRAVR